MKRIWNVMDKLKKRGKYALNLCWNVYIGLVSDWALVNVALVGLPVTGQYLAVVRVPIE